MIKRVYVSMYAFHYNCFIFHNCVLEDGSHLWEYGKVGHWNYGLQKRVQLERVYFDLPFYVGGNDMGT